MLWKFRCLLLSLPQQRTFISAKLRSALCPTGDVTPVYWITLPTIAGDHEGSFMPNVLAVLSRRFSLSVPLWLPWTIVHLQRGS
jgi:hypothetical protein